MDIHSRVREVIGDEAYNAAVGPIVDAINEAVKDAVKTLVEANPAPEGTDPVAWRNEISRKVLKEIRGRLKG